MMRQIERDIAAYYRDTMAYPEATRGCYSFTR